MPAWSRFHIVKSWRGWEGTGRDDKVTSYEARNGGCLMRYPGQELVPNVTVMV